MNRPDCEKCMQSIMDCDCKIWTSLRIGYPIVENVEYEVKDCRHNILGSAFYNGYDFEKVNWKIPLKGSLMLCHYIVTHWSYANGKN